MYVLLGTRGLRLSGSLVGARGAGAGARVGAGALGRAWQMGQRTSASPSAASVLCPGASEPGLLLFKSGSRFLTALQ